MESDVISAAIVYVILDAAQRMGWSGPEGFLGAFDFILEAIAISLKISGGG